MASKYFDKVIAKQKPETKIFVSKYLDIVERIHQILAAKGLTQKDLAQRLDKRESEVSRWLGGSHNLTLKSIAKLEAALDAEIIAVPQTAFLKWKQTEVAHMQVSISKNKIPLDKDIKFQEPIQLGKQKEERCLMRKFGPLIPDKLHLLRVDIVKGLIENPPELKEDDIEGYEFGMGYFNGFNLDEQLVKTELEITISTVNSSESSQAKGLFRLAFHFKIENFDELVRQKKEGLEVSSILGNALASISYSTSRGILLTRFQGTILKDFILPVIDPNVLLDPESNLDSQSK